MFNFKSIPLHITRECLVNLFGYKLGLRKLAGKSKLNNITWDLDRDLEDKGYKNHKLVKTVLDSMPNISGRNRMVEMGPGGTLIHGLMSVDHDWKEYIGVDVFPSEVWSEYPVNLYKKYIHSLDSTRQEGLEEKLSSSIKGQGPVRYFGTEGLNNAKFNDLVGESSVDLIYSWGVLEHIPDPLDIFRENYRILSKNGIVLHVIDPHPHVWHRFKNPHAFLTIPDWLWKMMYGGRGFINRFMPLDYIQWAKEAGFKVESIKREYLADAVPEWPPYEIESIKDNFLERYRHMPDDEFLTHRIYLVLSKE